MLSVLWRTLYFRDDPWCLAICLTWQSVLCLQTLVLSPFLPLGRDSRDVMAAEASPEFSSVICFSVQRVMTRMTLDFQLLFSVVVVFRAEEYLPFPVLSF